MALVALAGPAGAQDRVVLQPEGGSSRIILNCVVSDFTGREIAVHTSQGRSTFPSEQVIEVHTAQLAEHDRGVKLFAEGDFGGAKEALETAVSREERLWVRREILALLVRCGLRTGDYSSAAARFLMILESDPETRHLHLIPLAWVSRELPPTQLAEAKAWLVDRRPAARLLGASWLVDDPFTGDKARKELEALSTNAPWAVQQLAQAQLWRVRLRTDQVSEAEIDRWERRVELLPEKLRGGPYYLVGQGWLGRREHERAAAALLWLPLVYDYDHALSGRACLHAADALRRMGQQQQSALLYREVAVRYADTGLAREARSALERLETGADRASAGDE